MTAERLFHDVNNVMFSIIIDADILHQTVIDCGNKEDKLELISNKLSCLERNINRMKKIISFATVKK